MKTNLKVCIVVLLVAVLLFVACKNDDPTGPDDNDPVVTDPNPPDYPSFVRGYFQFDVEITKQYDTHTVDDLESFSPTWSMLGGFSNGVFYAESTWTTFDGEQTEQLTITMDTLTGRVNSVDFHQVFNNVHASYEMSISLSNIARTDQSSNYIAFEVSGMDVCNHINSVDFDYENFSDPTLDYIIIDYGCLEGSDLHVSLNNY